MKAGTFVKVGEICHVVDSEPSSEQFGSGAPNSLYDSVAEGEGCVSDGRLT